MKLLTFEELALLLMKMNPRYKFEQELAEHAASDDGGPAPTGRYHLYFDFDAPPAFTGIGAADAPLAQSWLLRREEPVGGEPHLVFDYDPDPAVPVGVPLDVFDGRAEYEGYRLAVPSEDFCRAVAGIAGQPGVAGQLAATIGLERVASTFG